ncbi:unnamed protein product, partial [Rotaria magnacalcarata]
MEEEIEAPMTVESSVEPSKEEMETPMTVEPSADPKKEEKGYLARDEYTSERFKLEINNLPKYFGFG